MATPTTSHTFQSLAASAVAAYNRKDSERLFYEALEDARAEASSDNDTGLVRRLASIDDQALLKNTVKHELQGRVGRRVIKFTESLNGAAQIALAISECNATIAKPVVGLVCYIMTILQELPNMQDLIRTFKRQMEQYLNSFKEHFLDKGKMGSSLEESVKSVHRIVIDFGLLVIPLANKSTFKKYMGLVTNDRSSALVKLIQDLKDATDFVYNNAILAKIGDRQPTPTNTLAAPQTSNTPAITTGTSSTKSPTIPVAQTSYFTGRQAQLTTIHQRLGSLRPGNPAAVVLWGMGGIGKTQTSLRYGKSSVRGASTNPKYRNILFLHANGLDILYDEVCRNVLGLGIVNETTLQTLSASLIVESFLSWLRDTEDWLLIFDNVRDVNNIHRFRPGHGKGHIIFTTRDRYLADLLCGPDKVIELEPLTQAEGMELVRSIMRTSLPPTAENDSLARQVSDFALGLPLLIEQVAMSSLAAGRTLPQSMDMMKKKRRELLSAKAAGSSHEHNHTVAAILITSFETTQAKYPMAGALFQFLCKLEPSSIPMSLLTRSVNTMEPHLARPTMYPRGSVRTPEAEAAYQQRSQRQRFSLYDFNPWDPAWLRRILHTGEYKTEYLQPNLPRIDSRSDVEMQTSWQNNPMLKGVFDDSHQLNKAITQLEAAFLLRLQLSRSTIWIHDVFAAVMNAYIANESEELGKVTAHIAATLVWLAFPVPDSRPQRRDLCSQYLPHAVSCLGHLKEHGGPALMNDVAVGAELNHVVASTIFLSSIVHYDSDNPMNEPRVALLKKSVEHYKDALRGYNAAWKRVMAHPHMQGVKGRDRLIASIHTDMTREEHCQVQGRDPTFYVPDRWFSGCERFGNNALWRALQTAGRIGVCYWELRDYEEAELWLRRAKAGVEWIWGSSILCIEVQEMTKKLLSLKMEMEDWEGALVVAEELKTRYEALDDMGEGSVATVSGFYPATELSCTMGIIYHKLGKWEDAKKWFMVGLRGSREIHGRNGDGMWPILLALTGAYAEAGDWEGALRWWLEAVQTLHYGRTDRFWESRVLLASEGLERAEAEVEEQGKRDEGLRKETKQAQKVMKTYKGMVDHSRRIVQVGGEDLYSDEWTDEMRKWLKIGQERGIERWD